MTSKLYSSNHVKYSCDQVWYKQLLLYKSVNSGISFALSIIYTEVISKEFLDPADPAKT